MMVIVKIGTSSIINNNLPEENIEKLVNDIVNLKKEGYDVLLVSSGAVGFGKQILLSNQHETNPNQLKKIQSSIGQSILIHEYNKAFQKHNITCSQVLITKSDLKNPAQSKCIMNLLRHTLKNKNIVPIINENDAIANAKNAFIDNDELSGILAFELKADKLLILTNVEGVYEDFEKKTVIEKIDIHKNFPLISKQKSQHGRGGMYQKLKIAKKLAYNGIETMILNSEKQNILYDSLHLKNYKHGTRVVCDRPKKSKSNPIIKKFRNQFSKIKILTSVHDLNKKVPKTCYVYDENDQVIGILESAIKR